MLQQGGAVAHEEMVRTFNCGIGMAVILNESAADAVSAMLEAAGETVFRIGRIEAGERGCTVTGEGWSATHHA
jgi:phosphoribosylformylglycinamidine cyclo-ligase